LRTQRRARGGDLRTFGLIQHDASDREVNDLLKALTKEWAGAEEAYDFLCEYVHPKTEAIPRLDWRDRWRAAEPTGSVYPPGN
jgi:hypothetical protein